MGPNGFIVVLRCTLSSRHIANIYFKKLKNLLPQRVTFVADNDDIVVTEVFIFSLFFIMVLIVGKCTLKEFATYA